MKRDAGGAGGGSNRVEFLAQADEDRIIADRFC